MIVSATVAGWILVIASGTSYGTRTETPSIWPTKEICHEVGKSHKRVWEAARNGDPVSSTSKESRYLAYECLPLNQEKK